MKTISNVSYCYISIVFIVAASAFAEAQENRLKSEILSAGELAKVFPENVTARLKIDFPIFKVYRFSDSSGEYYCVLSESRDTVTAEDDTLSRNIRAFNFRSDRDSFVKIWEINDNIIPQKDERSIWFSTKYTEIKDFDGDGLVDFIITYNTSGINGLDDGRLKFIIYYKNRKVAIRHQNGVLDHQRETWIDKGFYKLPISLQTAVKSKMKQMAANNHAIFPAGWEYAMKQKKTNVNERR